MSNELVVVVAIVATVVAAVRSTWSPCSLSVLSTVTPLGEASRGHRYSVTVGAFVVGAVGGGMILGGFVAALAAVVRAISLGDRSIAVATAVASAVALAADLRVFGFSLPTIPRQVNERWLNDYRGWIYGIGYGGQIGVGFATYVMTAGLYLMIVLDALTGRPVVAFAIGAGFGSVRGLAGLLGGRLTTLAALHRLHSRLESFERTSWQVAVATQFTIAVVALAAIVGRWQAIVLAGSIVPLLVASCVRRWRGSEVAAPAEGLQLGGGLAAQKDPWVQTPATSRAVTVRARPGPQVVHRFRDRKVAPQRVRS